MTDLYLSESDPKYLCCCGKFHVKTLALAIAWLRLLVSLFVLGILILLKIMILLSPHELKHIDEEETATVDKLLLWSVPEFTVLIIISVLIIIADKNRKSWAYIPTLVFELLRIFIFTIVETMLLYLCVQEIYSLYKDEPETTFQEYFQRDPKNKDKFKYLIYFSFMLTQVIFIYVVTSKAYRYMKEINKQQPILSMEEAKRLNEQKHQYV